ncbi:MAG TPA: hypothetical protein VFT90_07805 [Chryseosolibacter sp.]|nr:hypothetical protein [Chryseosolibacter sp.]
MDKLFLGLVAIGMLIHSDSVFFRSDALSDLSLQRVEGDYSILDDSGNAIRIIAMEDKDGVIFWYRRIKTEVCQTGECKLVDVGLFWDCTGDFYGLEVYGEHLTKTDHSIFSAEDYQLLISILSNDWSILREYDMDDLTVERPALGNNVLVEGKEGVDATSGATRREIAEEAVKDAVYTTYTLWHLVHLGEKEQLEELTVLLLKKQSYVEALLAASKEKYDYFLLSLLAQARVEPFLPLKQLLTRRLQSVDDPLLQDIAVKALANADATSITFQSDIAAVYRDSKPALKLQILTALKDLTQVHAHLALALENDLIVTNEWLAVKILPLLMKAQSPSEQTLHTVRQLTRSKNTQVAYLAQQFLEVVD